VGANLAGEADQFARWSDWQPQPPVLQVQVRLGRVLLQHALVGPAPYLASQHAGDVLGQAHGRQRRLDVACFEQNHLETGCLQPVV
jgi:hypothetical protein